MRLKILLMLILSFTVMTNSCFSKEPAKKDTAYPIVADTIMHKALGDSVYRIITQAKRVEVSSFPLQKDSLKQTVTKKVSSKELELMKFIATNPKNYMSGTIVYGVFTPQFQAVYSHKKWKIILKYDFGLRKWGVFDADGNQIALYDLESDNMLRFACKMFPDNNFFHELLLTRE